MRCGQQDKSYPLEHRLLPLSGYLTILLPYPANVQCTNPRVHWDARRASEDNGRADWLADSVLCSSVRKCPLPTPSLQASPRHASPLTVEYRYFEDIPGQ